MVVSTAAPPVVSVQPHSNSEFVESATSASIAQYLASGERVLALMDTGWKVCVALSVLLLAAWAIGVLPAAVRLF